MTIKEAIEALIFDQLECQNTDCEDCPYNKMSDEDCERFLEDCAYIVEQWLASLPEGSIQNITLEDLL